MPGHFTHIYTARRVADYLLNGDYPKDWPHGELTKYKPEECGKIMQKWEKYTAIGAIGPDLFFFSMDFNSDPNLSKGADEIMFLLSTYYFVDAAYEDDWEPLLIILENVNSTMAGVIRFLLKLQKVWDKFVDGWNKTIGPLVKDIENLGDALTGGIMSEFKKVLEELVVAIKEVVEQEIVTYKDIFTNFNTCIQKGFDEQLFLWSDMTHYRSPSSLCQAFMKEVDKLREAGMVEQSEQFMAFALGYMTHIGTDTVGHSFVNEQCGGPFRDHPQRHHLIENHIDAWNYNQTKPGGRLPPDPWGYTDTYPDLSSSAMWYAVQTTPDNPEGDQRPDTLPEDPEERKKALDVDGEMPNWMAESIVSAMVDTFSNKQHPVIYQGSEFQNKIDEKFVANAVKNVTGKDLSQPFQELLDGIAPKPAFDVPKGFPLPWQIKTIYKFMITFYRLQFKGSWDLERPIEPKFFIPVPAEDVDDLLQPPDFSGIDPTNPIDDTCGILAALFEWIIKELGAGIKLAEDIIKMLLSPITYLPREGLYKLSVHLWDVAAKTHELMAHTGFYIPHAEQLYPDGSLRFSNEIDIPLVTLGGTVDSEFREALADAIDPLRNLDRDQEVIGTSHSVSDPNYPYYPVLKYYKDKDNKPTSEGWEYRRPWAWPDKSLNGDTATNNIRELYEPLEFLTNIKSFNVPLQRPGPYPRESMPDVLFRLDKEIQRDVRSMYENARSPLQTDAVNLKYLDPEVLDSSPIGDPIPFSAYLIGKLANNTGYATQFNLDSDRAFAYLTWDWVRGDAKAKGVLDVDYALPEKPPQAAEGWNDTHDLVGPNDPLLLTYIDLKPLD